MSACLHGFERHGPFIIHALGFRTGADLALHAVYVPIAQALCACGHHPQHQHHVISRMVGSQSTPFVHLNLYVHDPQVSRMW
jgi:hypothetical protein